jgi:hypothetical protein
MQQAMRLPYILRIKAEFPVNLWPNAAQVYHHRIKASIVQNKTQWAKPNSQIEAAAP